MSWVQWHAPVPPAVCKAKAGGWLEARGSESTVRLCLRKKKILQLILVFMEMVPQYACFSALAQRLVENSEQWRINQQEKKISALWKVGPPEDNNDGQPWLLYMTQYFPTQLFIDYVI